MDFLVFSSRVTAAWKLLPVSRLCLLALLSILLSWYFADRRVILFLDGAGGISTEQVGRINVALQTLDTDAVLVGALIFAAAGVIPIGMLLVRPEKRRSRIAQLIWATSIMGVHYAA